jgi:pilus assembly protein FimV
MTQTSRLLLVALCAMPGAAFALGLGEIHLQSALNQPLVAQIELVGATPEELPQLRATIAARETFQRYGIDRPTFLTNFVFKVGKAGPGHNVLDVTSTAPVTEPFVTFLVEVTWPRGKLVREYTMLLDPPVFEKTPTSQEPVAAAVTGAPGAEASGAVTRPAPAEAPSAATPTPSTTAPRAAPETGAAAIGSEYRVVRHDTLGSIVRRAGASTPAEANKLMIAIFRANHNAFDGNINRLRRGTVLRIPANEDYAGLSNAEARAEVHRQMDEWRGSTAGAPGKVGGGEPRLKLVMPSESPTPSAAAPAPGRAAPGTAPGNDADTKRLLELKADELARLQAPTPKPGATPVPAPVPAPSGQPVTPPPATGVPPTSTVAPSPVTAPPPAAGPATPPTAEAPVPTAPAAGTPTAGEPAASTAVPEKPKAVTTTVTRASPGLFDNFGYLLIAGVALVLAALVGFFFLRRQRASGGLPPRRGPFENLERGDGVVPAALATTSRIAREEAERGRMVVEESEDDSGEFVAPAPVRAAPRPVPIAPPPSTEDTLSSETALNLEQADPLAEADFHMAYGLYDQAADIVKLAIDREPDRRDLRLKLLEVYFVWGNKDAFLDVARELGKTREQGPAGEWDKVIIMGRQIAPEEALFAGTAPTAAGGVDLDLDNTGINRVDLELIGEAETTDTPTGEEEVVDLDLSSALGGSDATADTGESQALDEDDLESSFGASATGIDVTQEMGERGGRRFDTTIERPGPDSPTVESDVRPLRSDTPTIESPALRLKDEPNPMLRAKLGARLDKNRGDVTSELALDDLGFDVSDLEASSISLPGLELTDHPADAPTLVAGMDERSRRALRDAAAKAAQEPTREIPRPADKRDDDPTVLAPHAAKTRVTQALHDDVDVDLDELSRQLEADTVQQPHKEEARFSEVFAGTGRFPAGSPRDIDLDVGSSTVIDRAPTVTERIATGDGGLPELEPVTLSEVGTKLDLARAYMDMGDPEGARSILQEVMTEGSASQKQEAQRLLGTLPG